MSTKNSQARRAKKGSGEALSPLERLLAGKAGPLPVDSDHQVKPQESAVSTSGETPSLESDGRLGERSPTTEQRILARYPDLTEEKLDEMIDAMI